MNQATQKSVETTVSAINDKLEDHEGPLLVALDGRSGSGKSTIAEALGQRIGATVIDGDEFYAGGSQEEWLSRSAEEKVAKGMDWRRMRKEALEPLLAGRTATWRMFDWDTMKGVSDKTDTAQPADVVILDGAYSTRPELQDIVDLSVLVQLPDDIRRERLRNREGENFVQSWHTVWDEAEDYYFGQVRPQAAFDLIISTA